MDGFAAHPYWRADYFQVGPYRPVKFEPQQEMVLEAVPHYFLGKPKIDTIVLKQYADAGVLYAAVLAGAIDVTADNALGTEHAMELKDLWSRTGEGRVYIGYGTTRAIFPMFNPETQAEPGMLDPRVRQALYTAIDRDTWTSAMLVGNRDMASYSLLPPDHSMYEYTRDSFRMWAYDPQRALRMMDEAGWSRGADGTLRNRADGRPFKQEIWTGGGQEGEASILSDMWQAIGLQTNIFIPRTAQNDRILGQSFPGIEISARGGGDGPLTRAECATVPVPPRWDGANRGHYCNPEMDRLIGEYRGSLTREDRGRWIGEIARYYAYDLPSMQLYFNITRPTVVKGLTALADDFNGGTAPQGYYGSYFRNAHEWEWTL
jgi:peptide/nickel transport system substrate-binding protein